MSSPPVQNLLPAMSTHRDPYSGTSCFLVEKQLKAQALVGPLEGPGRTPVMFSIPVHLVLPHRGEREVQKGTHAFPNPLPSARHPPLGHT